MSVRLPLALVVWIGAVVAAIALSSAVAGGIRPARTASGSVGITSDSGAAVDPSSVRSTDPLSLFHPANLTAALAKLRSRLGPTTRLDSFVIYPGYVSATAVRGGTEIEATDFVNGTYDQQSTGGSPGSGPLLALSAIDPRAPAAFIARIGRLAHVRPREVRYMIAAADPISHKLSFSAYLLPGSHIEYLSAASGGPLRELPHGGSLQTLRG